MIRWPAASAAGVMHEVTARRPISTVQAPHAPSPQPNFGPGDAQVIAEHLEQAPAVVRRHRPLGAVDDDRYCHRGSFLGRVYVGITTGIVAWTVPREHRRVRPGHSQIRTCRAGAGPAQGLIALDADQIAGSPDLMRNNDS